MRWPIVGCMSTVSQFSPHNSTASQSLVVVKMQMDAHLKKEQIATLFVWVGALGEWVVPQGGPAQEVYVPSLFQKFANTTLFF